ncbi:coiled-coil domain-containing protein 180 isoform X4 [Takifugu flavidus]|uniref:coiled-coil domain-containing protein 180 isoform X4 n=1 Tax=Takifugu flavidus TaxID=433684 RepID=UPI0025440835|nr:coiled-coil domain-containing protein 180 isoform X4 [Takifugu flavidus]
MYIINCCFGSFRCHKYLVQIKKSAAKLHKVQLSRPLLAARQHPTAEDNTASRRLCLQSSRLHQSEDVEDVSRLPVAPAADHLSSDTTDRLTEQNSNRHQEALKQFETQLCELRQVYEDRVRSISMEVISSLKQVDLKLNIWRNRMEMMDDVSLQKVHTIWEEVQEQLNQRKMRMKELNVKLSQCETETTEQSCLALSNCCHLLDKINFLPSSSVLRLIHSQATMMNGFILGNRRSVAHLMLLLQEDTLHLESLLRLNWEECVSHWRGTRVQQIIQSFSLCLIRSVCNSEDHDQLVSDQHLRETDRMLIQHRHDIIASISSLAPPTCSTSSVCDWFNQLTAVNLQMADLYKDFLHQLRSSYKRQWDNRLADLQQCKEALSSLQLSAEQVNAVVSDHLLSLIGQKKSQDEKHLAAVELQCDYTARHTVTLSRSAFAVIRGAALLWEMHNYRLHSTRQDLQQQLEQLREQQQRRIQVNKVCLSDLLTALRQESSEDSLKTTMDQTCSCLQTFTHSYRKCISEQYQLLDLLPSLHVEEFLSYSNNLRTFFQVNPPIILNQKQLNILLPSWSRATTEEVNAEKIEEPQELIHQNEPCALKTREDWLSEAESSLLELYDTSSQVPVLLSESVTQTCPAFRCPAHDPLQKTRLSFFPMELLEEELSRMRILFLEHLEQHLHDVINCAVTTVTENKEVICLEQQLMLKQMNLEHIQTRIYQPRLAELQHHTHCVDLHCEELRAVVASCQAELQELQSSIRRRNNDFVVMVINMEHALMTKNSSQLLDSFSSTLQERLDTHMKHTQDCQSSCCHMVQLRLEEIGANVTQHLSSFRFFSEGGNFAPQEVKVFQRRLTEEIKMLTVSEENIYREQEEFQLTSFQQVKEVADRLQEKINLLKPEVKLREKVQKMMRTTQLLLKTEVDISNQQYSLISRRLVSLKMMMADSQVCPHQVSSHALAVSNHLRKYCRDMDVSLKSIRGSPKKKQMRNMSSPAALQPIRGAADLLEDPVVGVIRSLNRLCSVQDAVAERGISVTVQSPVHQPRKTPVQQPGGKEVESFSTLCSFFSRVTSVLSTANDEILLVGQDFYRSERSALGDFLLLPDTLDKWAESHQMGLLGYQEHANMFLSKRREELEHLVCSLDELLRSLPSVMISIHEQQQCTKLKEDVDRVRFKLEETLIWSQKEMEQVVQQLGPLTNEELRRLNEREELRQQQMQGNICDTHLQIQKCVQVRQETFVSSLESLTEKLLELMFIPDEMEDILVHRSPGGSTVTMDSDTTQTCTVSRSDDPAPIVTIATAATNSYLGTHLLVMEPRDTAIKRFQQLIISELSKSDDSKQQYLSELQKWNMDWSHHINTIIHTD